MYTIFIDISDILKVKSFVNIACKYNFEISLSSGKHIVNAKSIIGILSLDLNKPIQVTIQQSTNHEDFVEEIKNFIIPIKENV